MKENFYRPDEVDYEEIIPTYQEAFRGYPWYEVSKCADTMQRQRCEGGLSRIALNSLCGVCDQSPRLPAYEPDELVQRFETLAITRPTGWYIERMQGRVALAAITWKADAATICDEKYQGDPEMKAWMRQEVGTEELLWLDEVFADKTVRASNNLENFEAMTRGFGARLGGNVLAYRTINPAMIRVTERGGLQAAATVSRAGSSSLPDRRDFVKINIEEL